MSTNSNLQQINVFSKGMNTDTSDAFLSNEQYRYAENLRFITEDGNSNGGELRIIEGLKQRCPIYDINVLAISSIRQYIIIVGESNDGWYIYSVDTTEKTWTLTRHFGPCNDKIGKNISIVTRWESNNNIKVYIADGLHQLMSLNIARIDKEGRVKDYGTDIKDITGTLEIYLPQLNVSEELSTNSLIQAPVLQYAYVLYKLGGPSTSISPLSRPIVLYKDNKGYQSGENTSYVVNLTLDLNTSDADRIKVYRIGYIQNGQDPDIGLIYDGDFPHGTGHSFEFTDNGYDILTVTASEFIALNNIQFKPLLIESKNDYLFAANIQYDQQQIDDKFKDCTASYQPVLDENDQYSIDINNNVSGQYTASFKRGETYRFGIVFYDKRGRKSSVIMNTIDDVTIPNNVKSVFSRKSDGEYYVNPYKIRATVTNIPEDCSGYELVRCKRSMNDSRCMTQGIVGRAYKIEGKSNQNRFAFQYLTLDKYRVEGNTGDSSGSDGESCNDLVMFASPEYAYQPDDVKAMLNNFNTQLELNVISNHSVQSRRVPTTEKYKFFANPNVSHSTVIENITSGVYLMILGTGKQEASNFRENGEYFLLQNNVYTAMPGGLVTNANDSEVDSFTSAIEYDQSGTAWNKHINVCKLYPLFSGPALSQHTNININGIGYIDSPHGEFNNDVNVNIDNDKTHVGSLNFINWDAITFYGKTGEFSQNSYAPAKDDLFDVPGNGVWKAFGVTAGGKYILLNANVQDKQTVIDSPMSMSVAEIIHTDVTPYGGNTNTAKQNSVFYSFGDYQTYNGNGSATIETKNGDCYISMFVFNSGHAYDSGRYKSRMYPTVYIVPIESTINLKASYGDLYTNMTSPYKYWFQDLAGVYGKLVQDKNAYLYNTAYNGAKDLISLTPIAYTSISNDNFDCRVHYSQIKTNGEHTDSWLSFKSADFIDVDTRYGQITDLNLFKDTLVFWQDKAAGVLAVNERTMLQDVNDTNIILGNGDVLQRYDYLTTQYGMKPAQKARTQSNNALYWWDGYNKEILQYPGGHEVLPLKKVKTVSKYVNSIKERKAPALSYDNKYAEVLMCIDAEDSNKTLVYNEYIQQFTGVYNIWFTSSVKLYDCLILLQDNFLEQWNTKSENRFYQPILEYVVNKDSTYTKVYDNVEFGMGESFYETEQHTGQEVSDLYFEFKTPLKQESSIQEHITNREYDLRFAIPRSGGKPYGDRLRGRTMQCRLMRVGQNSNFSLQYIITKYRISYS